jgi:hypothetical protein
MPNVDSNSTSRLRAVLWGPVLSGILWGILAGLTGCVGSTRPDVPATLVFVLPNGWNVNSATYVVWSSNQLPIVEGTEDLSAPNAELSLSLLVPPGNGDVLQVTATTSSGTSCRGTSPPFDVVSGLPTQVSLVLSCALPSPDADNCPTVDVQPPTPPQASAPAGRISVAATASDTDPGDVVSFSWTASAGTFGDPTAPSTYYLCTTAGAQTLVLDVDDHHVPTSCAETFLLPITCLPGGSDAGTCTDGCAPPADP